MLRRHSMPAPAAIDGHVVPGARTWELGEDEARYLEELNGGGVREYVLESPAGYPEVPRVLLATLDWAWLEADDSKALLKRIMRIPGIHHLVLWREEELTYLGDGDRAEFFLPNGWTCAFDSAPVPQGMADLSAFEMAVRLGVTGDPLPLSVKTAADYAAGSPPPGEVWRLEGGATLKLGEPVSKGERLFVDVVPVYRVLRVRDNSLRRLEQPVHEPMRLQLREAPL